MNLVDRLTTETNMRVPVSLALAEHHSCKVDCAGSIPVTGSKLLMPGTNAGLPTG